MSRSWPKREWPAEIAIPARAALRIFRTYDDLVLDEDSPEWIGLHDAISLAWRWRRYSSDRRLRRENVSRALFLALGNFRQAVRAVLAAKVAKQRTAMFALNREKGPFE